MPGSVLRIGAAAGDTVTAGQPLVWLEAMKMEHTITAASDGMLAFLERRCRAAQGSVGDR
nr:carbamoyl-phosphate synthase ATP-binding subunit L [Mycolicibacterium malmesburyense]